MKKPSVQMAFFVHKKPSKSEGYIVESKGVKSNYFGADLGLFQD